MRVPEREFKPQGPDADGPRDRAVRFYQYAPKLGVAPEKMFHHFGQVDYDLNSTIGIYCNPDMMSLSCGGTQKARGQLRRGNDKSFNRTFTKMAPESMFWSPDLQGNYGPVRGMQDLFS